MAEARITIEIQDAKGIVQKTAVIAVPEDISRNEIVNWAREKYPHALKDPNLSVFVDWDENQPGSGKLVSEGSRVVIKPRSTLSSIRVIEEK
ncbi:MAG: hypothetical protein NT121_04245 [Chloroflexi bacterium]|nr:hypothetical protein [Chloroflexota bacterium]